MKRKDIINAAKTLEKEAKNYNQEAKVVKKLVKLYLPRFLEYPESASIAEINRYNSLVRSNVFDKDLREKLLIR